MHWLTIPRATAIACAAILLDFVIFLDLFDSLAAWFTSLQPQLQGAIVSGAFSLLAATVALFGVSATIVWNRYKHRQDVAFNLRKETYLTASDSFAAIIQFLGLIPSPDTKIEDSVKLLLDFSAAIGKIHTVASREVRASVLALQREVIVVYLGLAPLKHELNEGLDNIQHVKEVYEGWNSLLSDLNQRRESGESLAVERFESVLNQLAAAREKLEATCGAERDRYFAIRDIARDLVLNLQPYAASTLSTFRCDLGLDCDHEWFLSETEKLGVETKRLVKIASEEIDRRLKAAG